MTDTEYLQMLNGHKPDKNTEKPAISLPWFLDVWLFPCNITGAIMMVVIIGLTTLISFFNSIALGTLIGYVLVAKIIISAFMYWYFAVCIRESANGETRAPQLFSTSEEFNFTDMLYLLVPTAIFILPAVIYAGVNKVLDTTFWGLLGVGVVFLPMSLLSVIMHDSLTEGMNPFKIVWSMIKTLPAYVCVLVMFYGSIALNIFLISLVNGSDNAAGAVIIRIINLYFLWVCCHILGRFYCMYEKRLDWV